MSEDGNEPPWK